MPHLKQAALTMAVLLLAGQLHAAENPFVPRDGAGPATTSANPFRPHEKPVAVKTAPILPPPNTTAPEPLLPPPIPPASPDAASKHGASAAEAPTVPVPKPKCNIELVGKKTSYQIPASGGSLEVAVKLSGGSRCTKAAIADDDWIRLGSFNESKLLVTVAQNTAEERESAITLVASDQGNSVSVRIVQAGVTSSPP